MADTAAQNAVNAQNAQNAFSLSSQANAQLWQELRDFSNKEFTKDQTQEERLISVINAGFASESFMTDNQFINQRESMYKLIGSILDVDFATAIATG